VTSLARHPGTGGPAALASSVTVSRRGPGPQPALGRTGAPGDRITRSAAASRLLPRV